MEKENRLMKRKKTIIIIGIFIGALVLRVYSISRYDLWFDELVSNYYSYDIIKAFAELNGSSLASYFAKRVASDPSSAFYYMVVYVYSFLFGSGQMLRLLSAIFSVLALGMFYKFSRLFFDKKVCIYATLIMALSPVQIWYAQEARVYAMATFLVLSTAYLFTRALKTERLFYLILFTLSCAATFYMSYFSVFLLLPMGVMFILHRRGRNKIKWTSVAFLILLSIMPVFFILPDHLNLIRNGFWLAAPSLRTVLNTFTVFILGYSSAMWQVCTAPTIFIGLYLYGLYCYFRNDKKNAVILCLLFLPPIALTYLISRYIAPVYLDRQLLIYSPFYYLLVAKGALSIKTRFFRRAVMTLIMVYIGFSLTNYYQGFMLSIPESKKSFYVGMHVKKDYSGLISFVDENLRKSDAILATDIQSYIIAGYSFRDYIIQKKPSHIGYFFYAYAPEICLGTRAAIKAFGIKELSLKTGQLWGWWFKNGKIEIGKMRLQENGIRRVWIISSSWHLKGSLPRNSVDFRHYMSSHYKNVLSTEKDGVYVDLFEITQTGA